MSGRSGYRKTERRIEFRRLPGQMPPWQLSFEIPEGLPRDPLLLTGVSLVGHWVTIEGQQRDWVMARAVRLLRRLDPSWNGTLRASLRRGPRLGRYVLITARANDGHVVDGGTMRQLPLALA